MCAAPGSKTTHIAALMGNRGSIDAWDVYPHKVKLIKDNAKRLGISIIHTEVRDSVKPLPFLYETYDKVLLDAPCSGLGVLGHKVELRWRRKESDLSVFPPLQKQLIEQAAKYTKTGGVLVYSTCTLNPDENEHIINEFLSLHSEFAPEEFNFPVLGKSLNGMMTLYPDLVRSDGFFVAKLRKVSHEA
jgi:ribosomal RNA small subunit methyltransferase B